MLSDGELLGRYIDESSEAAFSELVARHVNLVYFAALRRVGFDTHCANDVTQRVFTDLARKAGQLKSRPSLAGWLHTATRFVAAELVRREQRRRTHEQEAHAMNELNAPAFQAASRFDPVLDEVLDVLSERDRDAVLLHFFEGRSFVEVGAALSVSADAARMRVNRALEQLRSALVKRGVESTAAALAATLTAQSGLAAPASVASAVAVTAMKLAAAGGTAPLAGGLVRVVGPVLRSPYLVPAAIVLLALATVGYLKRPGAAPIPGAQLTPVTATAPTAPAAAPAAPADTRPSAFALVQEVASEIENAAEEVVAAIAQTTSAPPANEFEAMTTGEKDLLKTLWVHEQTYGVQPGLAWVFTVPATSPKYADYQSGRDELLRRNLVRAAPRIDAGVMLTPAGRSFAGNWGTELDTYPLAYGKIGPVVPPSADVTFARLSWPERFILRQLANIDSQNPPRAGVRFGIKQPPTGASGLAEFEKGLVQLLYKGWVELGPKGVIYLTDAGRAFCGAQAAEIAAFDPSRRPE